MVVGVNEYKSQNVPPLQFAVNDARAIRDRIVPEIPASHTKVLYLENAQATKGQVLDALEDLSYATPDDTVLIYFSMHGFEGKSRENGYLVLYDTDPWTLEVTGLPVDLVLQKVKRTPANRLFLILDACYSGSAVGASAKTFPFGPTRKSGPGLSPDIYDAVKSRRGHFVISASKPDEPSLELESLRHGLFTYFLLEALEGSAARPGSPFVTVSDVYDYVSSRVELFSNGLNLRQTPMMKGEYEGSPPLMTVVKRSVRSGPSDFETMIREARLSFESSRLIINANGLDRIDLYLGGEFQGSWMDRTTKYRVAKEVFDRYGSEIPVKIVATPTRSGRQRQELTFQLRKGQQKTVEIQSTVISKPADSEPLPPVVVPRP